MEKLYGLGEKGTIYVVPEGEDPFRQLQSQVLFGERVEISSNNLFKNDQKQLYKELNGDTQQVSIAPNAEEATDFWRGIWSRPVEHKRDAEWIGRVRNETRRVGRQEDIVVGLQDVKGGIRRMSNWKAPGPDGVQGFWFKKFTNVHQVLTDKLQECVAKGEVPEWMTSGRTNLFMKDAEKGPVAAN